MDPDLQAAIAASLAQHGGHSVESGGGSEDVIVVSEDVFSVELTDTDGDVIMFMLVDGEVQQYVNGNLEIARVSSLSIDESSGRVKDAKGMFTVPAHFRARLQSLKSLLGKAGVQIQAWNSDSASGASASTAARAASDDAAMEAALEASIAETRLQNKQLCLDTKREHTKGSVVLRQHNTINQFHSHFSKAIAKHHAPNSICGYMTIANCRLLRRFLEGAPHPLPMSKLRSVGKKLATEVEMVSAETERAMQSIAAKRKKWMDAHPKDFASASERLKYLRAWVANFEISEELREDGLPLSFPASSSTDLLKKRERESKEASSQRLPSLHFARYNEYPQREIATHEERHRILVEQKRFGGYLNERGESVFTPPHSAHILERFSDSSSSSAPPPELLTPAEWQAAEARAEDCARVVALDLNGHFAAAVVARVYQEGEGEVQRNVVQVFNTTEGNYLDWPMLGDVHGFMFQRRVR